MKAFAKRILTALQQLNQIIRKGEVKACGTEAPGKEVRMPEQSMPVAGLHDDAKVSIEIWSDPMCPFCYIARRKLESALDQFSERDRVEITLKSFQLDPSAKFDPSSNAVQSIAKAKGMPELFVRHALSGIEAQARKEGLNFDFSKAKIANTFDAHRLCHFAATQDKGGEMEESLFKAFFVEGRNISDYDTLTQMGADLGLPEQEVRMILESGEFSDSVRQDMIEARQLGVRGLPYFLFNRQQSVGGLQSSSVYLKAMQKALADSQAAAPAGSIEDTAGKMCDLDGNCF